MTVREMLIATGAIREVDTTTQHTSSDTPVLRLDDVGRRVAAERIAHPEPERGEWRRERQR